jgi:hypothetical protein
MSKDSGAGVQTTSRGGLELGPHEDKGVRGSGWVVERRKFRTPKVCFLFRKIVEVHGQAPRVAGYKEVPYLHMHTGPMAAGSPWYGPSWEEAWITQGRKRASWPRRPIGLEPIGHLPPPHGQKPPVWKEVAQTNQRVARPPLRSILTGVCQPTAPFARSPRPKTEKSSCEGKVREAKLPPDPSPHHRRMQI